MRTLKDARAPNLKGFKSPIGDNSRWYYSPLPEVFMARYCSHPDCTRLSKLRYDKCKFHITPADRWAAKADKRKRKYERFVKKLTKLPAKNQKKGRIINSLLEGKAPEAQYVMPSPKPKTILRKK